MLHGVTLALPGIVSGSLTEIADGARGLAMEREALLEGRHGAVDVEPEKLRLHILQGDSRERRERRNAGGQDRHILDQGDAQGVDQAQAIPPRVILQRQREGRLGTDAAEGAREAAGERHPLRQPRQRREEG